MRCLYAFVALWMAVAVEGQRQYYNIHNMPITKFDCRDKILGGYYADPEVNCQMFHVCVKIPGQGVQDFRFLCPNETVFDQEQQICADSGEIDCASSGLFFDNFDLYRLGSAQAAKAQPTVFGFSRNTAIPLGPSTPSPLLTNSVVEDDDFYLQRSETGDRRLHAKDLLRGSSSSNLFNTRNGGKDLDDDDDDAPRTVNETPQSYRPKSSQQTRGKSQYNTQFRRTESPTPSTTVTVSTTPVSTTTTTPVPPRTEEKKRTKVAVRKLARKRVTAAEEKTTPASFTTQVTQRLSFGEPQRYNTINRAPATSSAAPQQQNNRQYQNFRPRSEQSTPAAVPINYQQQNNRGTTPSVAVNYQQQNRETTPAFQPSFQQNNNPSTAYQQTAQSVTPFQQRPNEQSSTGFHSTFRPVESSTPAFFEPSGSTSRPGFNGRPIVASQEYQSPQPQQIQTTRAPNQFNRGQTQFNQQQPRQGSQRQQPARQEFNRVPVNQNNQFNQQSQRKQPVAQNNQQQQNSQQFAQNNQQQFAQKTQQQQNNQQFAQNNQQQFAQKTQQQNQPIAQNNQQQQSNQQFGHNNQQQFGQNNQYQPQNNQQFAQRTQQTGQQFNSQKTQFNQNQQFNQQTTQQFNQYSTVAPQTRPPVNLPVVRAQTINAALQPQSTPSSRQFSPQIDDFEDNDKQEFLKTAPSSNFKPSDINSFAKSYKSQGEKSEFTKPPTTKYYTPTIVTTPKPAPASSPVPVQTSTATPARPAAPVSTPAQPAAPSAAPARPVSTDDKNDYDYAYYDDGNTFSEYDALDALNEQDFSRTSQRSKARLI